MQLLLPLRTPFLCVGLFFAYRGIEYEDLFHRTLKPGHYYLYKEVSFYKQYINNKALRGVLYYYE